MHLHSTLNTLRRSHTLQQISQPHQSHKITPCLRCLSVILHSTPGRGVSALITGCTSENTSFLQPQRYCLKSRARMTKRAVPNGIHQTARLKCNLLDVHMERFYLYFYLFFADVQVVLVWPSPRCAARGSLTAVSQRAAGRPASQARARRARCQFKRPSLTLLKEGGRKSVSTGGQ